MINHILLIFLVVSAIAGLFSLVTSFIVLPKVKNRKVVIYRILMVLFFSVIVFPGIARTYAENSGLEVFRNAIIDMPFLAIFLLSALVPIYANEFIISKYRKLINMIAIIFPTLTLACDFIFYPNSEGYFAPATLFIALIYGSITLLKGKNSELRGSYPLRRVEAIGMIIMIPVFVLSDVSLLFARDFFETIPFSILGVPFYLVFHCILTLKEDFGIISNNKLTVSDDDINSLKDRFDLTTREMEVVKCLLQGKTYSEIGDELCIAFSTAKKHMQNIYKKTSTSSKVELMMKTIYR